MDFKGNVVNLKLFSEITMESCIMVHHPKIYDQFSNLTDYYVIQDVNRQIDAGKEADEVIKQLKEKYLLKNIVIAYDKPKFSQENFTLSLMLTYQGSNDVLRIKQEMDTELDKLLTVDMDSDKITKSLKFRIVPNEVSDKMEQFIVQFRKYVDISNKKAIKINEVRTALITKYVKDRIDFNKQEEKMKQLLNKM